MYIITKYYKDGVLAVHQEMSYKTPEESKEFREAVEAIKPKMALLCLSNQN